MFGCSQTNAHEAILAWITNWFDLLAQGRIEEACARIDEPGTYGRLWSAEQIVAAMDEAFDSESRFRRAHPEGLDFSKPQTAVGSPFANINEYEDGSGYWAEHNVPISGEFSDLTAQFRFRWSNERLVVSLDDLRVI